MQYSVEHVLSAQAELGEGPVWHPDEKVLYFLDITQGKQHRFDPQTGEHRVTDLGVVTGAMGVRAAGGWVMATKKGFCFWDSASGQMIPVADPDPDPNAQIRFNDGKTDPQGRFWAGKMGNGSNNSLFRLDVDCMVHRAESGVGVSNGLGWSPDMKTFYHTDSLSGVISAYDYDAESGEISNRREFVRIPASEGTPDGLAVDSQGYIWSARWGGWKIVRYAPDGSVAAEVSLPVELVTSCAFGGANLDELYVTSAYIAVPKDRRAAQPLAGDVFRIRTNVPGLPEPKFLG